MSDANEPIAPEPAPVGPPPAGRLEPVAPDPRGELLRLAAALGHRRDARMLADFLRLRRAALAR